MTIRLITRPAIVSVLAASFAIAAAPPSLGGVPARDPAGRFLVLQVTVNPKPSTWRQAAEPRFALDMFEGNDLTGNPTGFGSFPSGLPEGDIISDDIRAPAGFRVNYTAFPICDIRKLQSRGPSGCPRGSRVGAGTVLNRCAASVSGS